MSKQKENKIPLACETQICHYKKQVSSQIDHPSHIMCAFLVCLYECVCVCVAYVVYVCVLCIISCVCVYIYVCMCVYICVCVYIYKFN